MIYIKIIIGQATFFFKIADYPNMMAGIETATMPAHYIPSVLTLEVALLQGPRQFIDSVVWGAPLTEQAMDRVELFLRNASDHGAIPGLEPYQFRREVDGFIKNGREDLARCRLATLGGFLDQCLGGGYQNFAAEAYRRLHYDYYSLPSAGGLEETGGHAKECLDDFLTRHRIARVGSVDEHQLTKKDLVPQGDWPSPRMTQFNSLGDTLLYGHLLAKFIRQWRWNTATTLVDYGAGSSVPTLRALLENPAHSLTRVVAVDVDEEAMRVSRENAELYNLAHRYHFERMDMLAHLGALAFDGSVALTANPPYLPVPPDMAGDPHLVPVDGGPDGTRFHEALLTTDIPVGTLVALTWSSLSNPIRMIHLLEGDAFTVLYVEAHRIPFGTYTSSGPLHHYLETQREAGLAVFDTNSEGQDSYIVIGTILRKIDPSERWLNGFGWGVW